MRGELCASSGRTIRGTLKTPKTAELANSASFYKKQRAFAGSIL
jgi:hypothetical protein